MKMSLICMKMNFYAELILHECFRTKSHFDRRPKATQKWLIEENDKTNIVLRERLKIFSKTLKKLTNSVAIVGRIWPNIRILSFK